MKKFLRKLHILPKQLAATLAIALMAFIPIGVYSANQLSIESTSGIANQTQGDTQYSPSVNAGYDDVLKVQVWYHNKEEAGSGKVAENLRVKINVPNAPGAQQQIASTVSADNSNSVTSTVLANLGRQDAKIQ